MKNLCSAIAGGCALLAACGSASAQTYPGPGFAINDLSANSSTLVAAGAPAVLTGVEVTIFNMQHTFLADLNAFLTAPNGDILTLFNDVPSGEFVGGNFNFADTFPNPVVIGNGGGGNFRAQGPGTFLSTYGGDNGNGLWRLNVNDEAGLDVGNVGSWELRLVPEPGTAALLGLAGLLFVGRRR